MIKKITLILSIIFLSYSSFAQENEGNIYWYTSPDTNGYISFQKLDSVDKTNKIPTVKTTVKANFDNELLNFSLSTYNDSDKMVNANKLEFNGTIGGKIEPVSFNGTKIKTDKKNITFWHFKGDFVDDMETDPDIKRFCFAKYNSTLKLPAITIPSFNLWAIIPKLPFDRKGTFKFNALDETKLYVMKKQTVNYLGTITTPINGEQMKLHKFVHQGEGIKPSYFWVNNDRELMQVLLDDKYTFTISTKEAALQTGKLTLSE